MKKNCATLYQLKKATNFFVKHYQFNNMHFNFKFFLIFLIYKSVFSLKRSKIYRQSPVKSPDIKTL